MGLTPKSETSSSAGTLVLKYPLAIHHRQQHKQQLSNEIVENPRRQIQHRALVACEELSQFGSYHSYKINEQNYQWERYKIGEAT